MTRIPLASANALSRSYRGFPRVSILYIDGIVAVVEEVSISGNSDREPQFDSIILVSNRHREREMIRIAAFVHRSQD